MKISLDWISDFADLPKGLSDEQIAERVTLGLCEVEGTERPGAVLRAVVAAQVVRVEKHPKADKLKLAELRLGDGRSMTVVCGAPNCREGIKTAYAAVGTVLPGGLTLEPRKIRGVLSEGMLCSEAELGLSGEKDGIMELPEGVPVGMSLGDFFAGGSGLGNEGAGGAEGADIAPDSPAAADDLILDVDNKSLTHRPDCWGHYGLAREFAAIFSRPFRERFSAEWAASLRERIGAEGEAGAGGGKAPVSVQVDPESSNLGFLALSMDIDAGVSSGSSPAWMRRRLSAAGMRPINAIVDISNYVMLETGIPNHIFDRSAVRGGRIVVRRAGEDQDFTTLDDQKRRVLAADTLVCDAERPLAVAGVMGGLESSVGPGTAAITVEAANWKAPEVRRTAARLGLRTDASQRYEKSLDSAQLETCLLRIYELIRQVSPGARAMGGIQRANMPEPVELAVPTSPQRIAAVLGEEVDEERLRGILEALGFAVEPIAGDRPRDAGRDFTHNVHVPTWRSTKDIECEADIAEEVGRIIGYDNIRPESPSHSIAALRLSAAKTMFRRAQDYLVLRGRALEVMTYPLVGRALLEKAAWPVFNENLVLANALTPAHDRMRPSMIPSLLEAAAENNKEHPGFRIFECGRSYAELDGEGYSRDLSQIGIVFQELSENPFIPLADTVEDLLPYLGLRGRLVAGDPARHHPLIPAAWPGTHPHEFLDIVIGGISEGAVVSIHPQIARAFKLKGKTALALIDLTGLSERPGAPAHERAPFIPPDRFPGSDFDLTVVMPSHTHAAEAVETVQNMGKREIRSVGVLDVFPLENDRKALTLHIEFRDSEQTLDADFIKETEGEIIATLDGAGYALRD